MKFPLDIPQYQFDTISFQGVGNLLFLELSILFFQQITKLFSSVGQLTIFLSGTENYFPQWVRKLFSSVGQWTTSLMSWTGRTRCGIAGACKIKYKSQKSQLVIRGRIVIVVMMMMIEILMMTMTKQCDGNFWWQARCKTARWIFF